jgi:D-beta-D-heptose 7-phosphate kinase/D-beta-D-heptose 1-phosphate adenosyltransferase
LTRPTTNKTRFILRGQLRSDRFDFESKAPIPGDAAKYLATCPIGDALLIQDYGKGVCTTSLLRSLLSQATAAGVPVLVDPARGRDWRVYEDCTVIKANRIESAEALGCRAGDSPAMMARRLAIRQACHVVVTAGELGLWWSDGRAVRRVPAIPVQVRDVCGAGDTVLATLGMVMAAGGTIADGCRRAVQMAAKQVGQVGVGDVGGRRHVG